MFMADMKLSDILERTMYSRESQGGRTTTTTTSKIETQLTTKSSSNQVEIRCQGKSKSSTCSITSHNNKDDIATKKCGWTNNIIASTSRYNETISRKTVCKSSASK